MVYDEEEKEISSNALDGMIDEGDEEDDPLMDPAESGEETDEKWE
ncbi:MAG TPA: hypothetical protein VG102_02205 [Candidatus Paceibacterota bacterium]|jgi:hypothetical protein|nr:hypothetical protein [Candidatus Paceibacterota bacterium]